MGSDFLRQFQAGFQMGQSRNENARRDQELQMEQQRQQQRMQQEELDRQLRRESLDLQKKQINTQIAQHEFESKAKAAAMMSEQQQVLPPSTEDLGGGATLNFGAMTQPRAPMMAEVPGEPGTQVQVPFFEELLRRKKAQDEQDAQMAATQAGAVAKAQEPYRISDDERASKLAAQRDAAAIARAEAAAARAAAKQKGDASKLRKEYNSEFKPYVVQIDAYNKALSLTDIPDEQRTPQDDISLVFLYMKSLDPTSTVREGEYATAKNAAGVPDRVRNQWNQLVQGKFLTPAQRAGMGSSIKRDWDAGPGKRVGIIQKRYDFLSREAGIDPTLVLMDEGIASPSPAPAASAGPAPAGAAPAGGTPPRPPNVPPEAKWDAVTRRWRL